MLLGFLKKFRITAEKALVLGQLQNSAQTFVDVSGVAVPVRRITSDELPSRRNGSATGDLLDRTYLVAQCRVIASQLPIIRGA